MWVNIWAPKSNDNKVLSGYNLYTVATICTLTLQSVKLTLFDILDNDTLKTNGFGPNMIDSSQNGIIGKVIKKLNGTKFSSFSTIQILFQNILN